MANCKAYVAMDETTGSLYDREQLIEIVETIAKPIDYNGRDGIHFEVIGSNGLRHVISIGESNGLFGIGPNDETANLIKSNLEALAVNLRLEELN